MLLPKACSSLLDAEDELASMKLSDNSKPKSHLAELIVHFQHMVQCWNNLIEMGSLLSDTHYWTIIMHSLPDSYQPVLQTINAMEQASVPPVAAKWSQTTLWTSS